MTTVDLLIRGCMVLLPDMSLLRDAAIAIREKHIVAIETDPAAIRGYQAAEVIDGAGKLAMPGFVDAHTHSAQQLLRGSVVDELPMIWTRILVPFESALTPEEVYAGSMLMMVEHIRAGITAFADAGGPHMEGTAQAVVEAGVRAVIAPSTMDTGAFIPPAMLSTVESAISRTETLHKAYHGAGEGRVKVWFGLRQVMTSTPALVEAVAARAREMGTGVHFHLAEHMAEVAHCLENYKLRPAFWLDRHGLLGPHTIAGHCVRLSDEEILLLKERDANAVHCPHANLGSHGFSKTPLLLALGVNVGLGNDGASGVRLDHFNQMRLLRSAMQAYHGVNINDPLTLPALQALRMATHGGARALGIHEETGTLEVGKKADVILLDLNRPHFSPTANVPKSVVTVAGPDDVCDVIVDGRVLLRDRVLTHLDEEAIRRRAGEVMLAVGKRAGLDHSAAYVG
ncbi:MAG: amidohydrolase [Anaerolineae bacterium]|nr:amidohydrolase [Anaerolineae bacterium]